ncbi:MAG: hypothetical protein Ct9H300mP16_10210 [Pseudomonadota bacterium]|nr:MAG: hypothetical protein Ct9H300mP16_10210 [Pseudomonadota bacterium]
MSFIGDHEDGYATEYIALPKRLSPGCPATGVWSRQQHCPVRVYGLEGTG